MSNTEIERKNLSYYKKRLLFIDSTLETKNRLYGILFVSPALIVMIVVLVVPLFGAAYFSLNDFVKQELTYVGFENYSEAITNPDTWNALMVNIKFTFFSVLFSFLLGFTLSMLLFNLKNGTQNTFRIFFTLPWPIMAVVVGIIFTWMFNAQYGVINELLLKLGLIDNYRSWLGNIRTAFPIVVSASVWKEAPFYMIMILAGLQAIPQEQFDAASVDGTSELQKFFFITLPNLRRVITITIMLQIIWRFREFDIVAVMTKGGPAKATEVLSVLVYRYCFKFFRFGEGAAIAVIMSIISMTFTIFYLKTVKKEN